jgi:hypothetical protein
MKAMRTCLTAVVLTLGTTLVPVLADDWKPLAQEQGVVLTYQAIGNQVRLRLSNSTHDNMTATWKLRVLLASGTSVDNLGELNLAAGETETVASAPYHDATGPVEVKSVAGTLTAKKAAP